MWIHLNLFSCSKDNFSLPVPTIVHDPISIESHFLLLSSRFSACHDCVQIMVSLVYHICDFPLQSLWHRQSVFSSWICAAYPRSLLHDVLWPAVSSTLITFHLLSYQAYQRAASLPLALAYQFQTFIFPVCKEDARWRHILHIFNMCGSV